MVKLRNGGDHLGADSLTGNLDERDAAVENDLCRRNILHHVELGGIIGVQSTSAQPDDRGLFG